MLAGVGGIDLVMLVIAADEGVMPQTREHLAICSLLHTKAGLVVLAKSDLVDGEWLELVRDDVRTLLRDTFLADCPILAVSSKTGEGLPQLRSALSDLARRVPPKALDQSARLPIDRVFSMKGFGTVVTGTLTSGRLALDDRVEIFPKGLQAKVRGLQCHGRPVAETLAGQRTAVNLQGIDRAAIERGDVLAFPGSLRSSVMVDATLELIAEAPRPLKTRDRVRFHVGTSEIMARVLLLDRAEIEPGDRAYARYRLEGPLVALPGDRYVIRSYSPIVTIGGGTLLDVAPPRFRRKAPQLLAHLKVLEGGSQEEVVEEHIIQAGASGTRAVDLRARTPFGPDRLRELLDQLREVRKIVAVDREWFLHQEVHGALRRRILDFLGAFHAQHPLRGGISREELRVRVGGVEDRIFSQLLGSLEAEGLVKAERDKVRLASYEVRLSSEQQALVERLESAFRTTGAAPPSPEEALGQLGLSGAEEHELFQLLVEDRRLVRVKESLFFHSQVLREIEERLVLFLKEKKTITPGDFKDLLGISRKYAIPLLEYFDSQRVTVRAGDHRVLRGQGLAN
jgi:selenocysteine-specific elongation factor